MGECGTHGITDAAFGPVGTGEQTLAARLIARFTLSGSITCPWGLTSGFQAAVSYSLMRPPRIARRRILP